MFDLEIIGFRHELEKRYYPNETQLRYKCGLVYDLPMAPRRRVACYGLYLPAIMFDFAFALLMIAWWPFARKGLPPCLLACCVRLHPHPWCLCSCFVYCLGQNEEFAYMHYNVTISNLLYTRKLLIGCP